jgi:hypothetical protein
VNLSRTSRRAYHEAWYRRAYDTSSKEWKQRPGSTYDLEIWMNAFDIATEENVSPWDALLLAVRRRAGRVRIIDRSINAAWDDHRRWCQENDGAEGANPDVPNEIVRSLLVESRNEERLLTRAAKMAIDAGVAKMLVERDQVAGRVLADALVAGLDTLDLTTEQRMNALGEAQKVFLAADADELAGGTSAIAGIVIDDDDDDKER